MAVKIAYPVARQIAAQAAAAAPREACGLLAGQGEHISLALPIRNSASSPMTHFQLAASEQIKALKTIDAAGLTWIGVYHSHPASPPIPSPADIAATKDYRLLHLIVSLERAKPRLKLWRIEGEGVEPLELVFDTAAVPASDAPLSPGQQATLIVIGIVSLLILLALSVWLLPPAPLITPTP